MASLLVFALPLLGELALSAPPIGQRPAAISYLPQEPAPLDEPPELARRLFELGSELALGIPHCAESRGNGCAALRAGPEFSLTGLLRPIPHFAFGASARVGRFSESSEGDAWQSSGQSTFFGLAARVYAFESGRFDPYLELDLGAGAVSLDVLAASGRRERAALLPALRSALGLDWALTSWLRCGAFLGYSQYLSGSASRCGAGGCSAISASQSSLIRGTTSLGLSLGIRAGEML